MKIKNMNLSYLYILQTFLEWIMCFAVPMFLCNLDNKVALIFILGVIAMTLYRIGNILMDKSW